MLFSAVSGRSVTSLHIQNQEDCVYRSRTDQQQHIQAEEELTTKGKVWLGCAAAAVLAFCAFSGQYLSIGIIEDDTIDPEDDL